MLTLCRQFIKASYPAIKAANPDLKFLIREASGVEARAFARFGEFFVGRPRMCRANIWVERGVESQTSLADMSEGDVNKALEQLVSRGPGAGAKA